MKHTWRLVGRSAELSFVDAALAEGRGVVFAGEPGVGKTRLLDETRSMSERSGLVALSIHASRSSSPLPLGAFAPLLDPATITPSLASARNDVLSRRVAGKLMLAIDDAHALDGASAALVHQLAADDDVTVLATVRSRETAPAAVIDLWKDALCERVEIQPLSESEVNEVVTVALGGPVDGAALHSVWAATRGNALFIRELLTAAIADGTLVQRHGVWSLTRNLRAPTRVRELLAERLADLAPDARTGVELLALGQPLSVDLLGSLIGDESVEDLETRGVVEITSDNGSLVVRLDHPLFGDVVLDEFGTLKRRRLLHDLVAARDPRDSVTDDHRVAKWCLDADIEVPIDAALAATQRYQLVDPVLAEVFARRAIEGGARVAGAVALADVHMLTGKPQAAEELLAATTTESLDDRVQVGLKRSIVLAFGLGRIENAATELENLRDEVDDEHWGEVVGQLSVVRLLAGDIGRALDVVESILDDPRARSGDKLWAELLLVPALCLAGRLQSAIDRASDIVPRIEASDDVDAYAAGHIAAIVSLCHLFAGDLDRAEAAARTVYDKASRANVRLVRGAAALHLGEVLLWRGQADRATPMFREAVASLDGDELSRVSAVDHLRYATVLGGGEDLITPGEPSPLYAVSTAWIRAAIAGAKGERSLARIQALEAVGLGLRMGQNTYAAVALYEAARVGAAEAAAELAEQMPPVDGVLIPLLLDAVRARSTDDGEALDRVSAELERLGYLLHAAELAAAAEAAFEASGLRARASAMGQRARTVMGRCAGVAADLLSVAPGADVLTRREREVAGLAARGATDAEIADRLFVSVRTVETHLHRAYSKLGVGGRADLADALGSPST